MNKCDITRILLQLINENSGKYSSAEIRNILMGGNEYKDSKDLRSYFNVLPANVSIYRVIMDCIKDIISKERVVVINNKLCILDNNVCRRKEVYNLFNKLKDKYNFEGFIHTTTFENFIGIMHDKYLYSRNKINELNKKNIDIANEDVIKNTSNDIKKMVRFYWRSKTPTNYTNEGIKPERILINEGYSAHSPIPVVLIFDVSIAFMKNVRFSDGNCGSHNCSITDNITTITDFNWDYVFHNQETYDRKILYNRQAELLLPNQIGTDSIIKIVFRSKCDKENAEKLLGKDERFCIDDTYFCNNFLYVKDYDYNISSSKLMVYYNISDNYTHSKFKHNLLDYTHTINLYCNGEITDSINLNEQIEFPDNDVQGYYLKLNKNTEYICYNIDDVECLRIKIND